jgi:type I restriction enzyme S subunit
MKNRWKTKSLVEVCQFSNGLWKGEKPPFVNVGVIRNTNFTKEGTLDDSDIAYLDVEARKLEKRRLQFGDIILEKSGGGPKQPVGRVALFDKADGDFSFSNFTAALRVLDPHELDFRFFHKFLHWTYISGVTEGMQSHSTGIRNLDGDAYKAIKIAFPSLPEQQRIVGLLDEGFEGVATAKANAERNLRNASALFESHLQSVFVQRGEGWVDAKLGDLCHKITDGTHSTPTYREEGIPFLSVKNLTQGFIDFSNTRFISIEEHEFLTRRCKPVRDDILYTKVGTTGVAQVVDVDDEFSIFVSVALLKPKHDVVFNLYLEHFLNAPYAREQARKRTRGMANKNLVITDIKEIDVHFPKALDEQRTIVTRLESLSAETQRLESIYQRKLAALEALRKSLLHQAFTGEL